MDQTAIKQIQKALGIDESNTVLKGKNTQVPVISLPDNFNVESLERFMPLRARFRGHMKTETMAAFTDYAKEHDDDSACFVDGENMSASIIFDLGNKDKAGHCEHKATIKAEKLADFKALLYANSERKDQKDISEWIEDWRNNITAIDEYGVVIDLPIAIGALRGITLDEKHQSNHQVGHVRAARTEMEEIEAKSEGAIPAFFRFNCRPYECLAKRDFDMRLSILTSHEKPTFVLRIKQLEKHEEEMAFEFTELVKNGLVDTDIATYMGSFSS